MRYWLAVAALIIFEVGFAEASITNIVLSYAGPSTNKASIIIQSNQVAQIPHVNLNSYGYSRLNVKLGDVKFSYSAEAIKGYATSAGGTVGIPKIAGPAEIEIEQIIPTQSNTKIQDLCVVEISSSEQQFTPSSAVVIPDDLGAPVKIILESSTDLITWVPAEPGTYGTSTQKRFFRVRAERQ